MKKSDKCVVILSHSSYSDIWSLVMTSYNNFFKEEDEFDFFISSDKISSFEKDNLKTHNFNVISYDENITWGESLKQTIKFLLDSNYKYVLFSFDDLILTGHLKKKVSEFIFLMKNNDVSYLQIKNGYRSWFDNSRLLFNKNFHKVSNDDSYKGSLVFSILDYKLMNSILQTEEISNYNPWQYEINAHKHFINFEFYCLSTSIVSFSNTIIKGKFNPIQLYYSEIKNSYKYEGDRIKMNLFLTLKFQFKYFLFKLSKNIFPKKLFKSIRLFKTKL